MDNWRAVKVGGQSQDVQIVSSTGGFIAQASNYQRAKFIAAAPDMFRALQEVVAELEAYEMPLDPYHPQCVAVSNARAALAKAQGRE